VVEHVACLEGCYLSAQVVQALHTPAEIPKGGQQTYVLAICDGACLHGSRDAARAPCADHTCVVQEHLSAVLARANTSVGVSPEAFLLLLLLLQVGSQLIVLVAA
jgi:hypothetical protein